jgi:hypothetical protein
VAAGCGDFEGAFEMVLAAAKELLKVAFGMNMRFKMLALDDPDLDAILGPDGGGEGDRMSGNIHFTPVL